MADQVIFTVIIEVPDMTEYTHEQVEEIEDKFAQILSSMEDVAAKQFSIYDAAWDYTE
jgi:hypothetical protein